MVMTNELSEEEKLAFAEEKCWCYRCATYIDTRPPEGARVDRGDQVVKTYQPRALGEEELAYCMRGRGKAITKEISCSCPGTGFGGCPVWTKFKLRDKFYCTRGLEKK
jgi:hypothetical protein